MRSGFTSKLFNRRGVYSPSDGRDERKLAELNREKAEMLEARGYLRFAISMREFSKRYELEAEQEASRDRYEN